MATNSMAGLFKTPEQVRAEQEQALMDQGSLSAGMLLKQPTRSGLAAGILGQGAAAAQYMPKAADRFVKGMMGAAGGVAGLAGNKQAQAALQQAQRSPEELKALRLQNIMKQSKGDIKKLKSAAAKLIEQGDPSSAYAVMQVAKELETETDSLNILDTNDQKNIAAIAKFKYGCDIKDPECYAKAQADWIAQKRENPMENTGYKNLNARKDEASAAARAIEQTNSALRTLDSGEVNVGSFANTRQGAMKLVSSVFGIPEGKETVARTALLLSQVKQLGGELLASGMFGEGTAISERDLRTALEIAGASESLTPESMKTILEANAKMQMVKIQKHNDRLKNYSEEFWGRTPEGGPDAFYVQTPELYKAENVGTDKKPKMKQVIFNDMMFEIPEGAQAGQIKGRLVYKLNGKYYDVNTGEVL
jgi:hypothetical protein